MNAIICPARAISSPPSAPSRRYRLGLTATPERADGRESLLPELIGPIVYRREIKQLAGDFLAEYRVERIDVDLAPEGDAALSAGARYVSPFRRDEPASRWGRPTGWRRFLQETLPLAGGPGRVSGVSRAKAARAGRPGEDRLARRSAAPPCRRSGDHFHLRQCHGVPDRPPLSGAGHHAPDQDARTAADPRTLPRRPLSDPGDEPGAQRGRRCAGGQRRHHPVRHRQRPRARAAPGPTAAQARRQAGAACTRSSRAAPRRNSPANGGGSTMRIDDGACLRSAPARRGKGSMPLPLASGRKT